MNCYFGTNINTNHVFSKLFSQTSSRIFTVLNLYRNLSITIIDTLLSQQIIASANGQISQTISSKYYIISQKPSRIDNSVVNPLMIEYKCRFLVDGYCLPFALTTISLHARLRFVNNWQTMKIALQHLFAEHFLQLILFGIIIAEEHVVSLTTPDYVMKTYDCQIARQAVIHRFLSTWKRVAWTGYLKRWRFSPICNNGREPETTLHVSVNILDTLKPEGLLATIMDGTSAVSR